MTVARAQFHQRGVGPPVHGHDHMIKSNKPGAQ